MTGQRGADAPVEGGDLKHLHKNADSQWGGSVSSQHAQPSALASKRSRSSLASMIRTAYTLNNLSRANRSDKVRQKMDRRVPGRQGGVMPEFGAEVFGK